MHWKIERRLRRIKGGRLHLGASVEDRIRKAVEEEARRHHTSMSFVMNVAIDEALGLGILDESYLEPKERKRTRAALTLARRKHA